jgi:dihydrofolate reductase
VAVAFAMRSFRQVHGMEGGETGPDDEIIAESTRNIGAALESARNAADGKDINVGGGADVAQQYLKAGLIDEMEVHVVPMLLGSGSRLFDNISSGQLRYESIRVVCSPAVTHFKYRLLR